MNKDEILLDIMEKVHDKVERISADVQDIKIQQARQDGVVEEHSRRSTASEGRLEFLENHVLMVNHTIKIIKISGQILLGFITVIGFFAKVLPWLLAR